MQKVAAYLLERRDGMDDAAARSTETERTREAILAWLKSKGADPGSPAGSFEPVDGGHGTFAIESAQDGPLAWWMVRLSEQAPAGRCFATSVSVTTTERSVAVYAALEAGADTTQISPLYVDPRCPHVVRSLLGLAGSWYHGASRLDGLLRVAGFDAGERLAERIGDPDRTVPIVVVSEDYSGRVALADIDDRLAYDLAGLANVHRVDFDAAWGLTDSLGRVFTCFNGAVRVYWPGWAVTDHPLAHPRWTVERLQGLGDDGTQPRDRFRRKLRTLLMRTAALSVVRPRQIDAIRSAEARRVFTEMRANAASLEDYQQLAETYAEDNDRLRADLEAHQEKLKELETTVANLELRLRYAERPQQPPGTTDVDDLEPDAEEEAEQPAPQRGEVRFYKKLYSAPTHDILTAVQDCGCNRWENANKAEKAKKGVAKLEGRDDWQSIQHCAKCTGGGMWKVRW
ncbi:MAG: hypothetical protein IT345_08685 [Trueperaceae bacterium]|nr:hypothetical protein [Trueperaceae bacterium]